MKERIKIILLVIAAILVLALIAVVSVRIYHNAQKFHVPGQNERQMVEPDVHSWMTVEEIAAKYETSTSAVFEAFNIQPESGDDKLTLRDLKNKYGKSRDEMLQGLDKIITSSGPPPGPPPDSSSEHSPGPGSDSSTAPGPATDKGSSP